MRNSDQVKEVKSYIVVWDSNKQRYKVKGEFWLPGYTEAHKATPLDAVQYELDKTYEAVVAAQNKKNLLSELGQEIFKETI